MDEDRSINALEVTADGLLRLARRNLKSTLLTYAALAGGLSGKQETELVLTDQRRSMISQMLRQMIGEIETAIRWHIMAQLEDGEAGEFSSQAALADRNSDGVFKFLIECGLLQDMDLIEAVLHRLCQHQLETALRSAGNDQWNAEPGLDRPGEFFFPPLAENAPARRRIAAYLVDGSRRTDSYGTPILSPGDMDPAMYSRLHWRVAAALRKEVVMRSRGNSSAPDALLETATSEAQRQSAAVAAAPTRAVEACTSLEAAGLLTAETVLRLLRAGEIPLFESVFARLAGIRTVLLRRLIYEPGGEGIAVLARALGMDGAAAATIFAKTRFAGKGLYLEGNDNVVRLEAVFDGISRQVAEQVRVYWASRPDYTKALWEAETGNWHDTAQPGR